MPRTLSQRVLLLGATALVAPAVLFAGTLAPRPALAACTVTAGGGTATAPGDGATVTCTAGEEPESDTVGDGTTDAQVVLEADARIDTTATSTDAIRLDDARVTIGDRARIAAGAYGVAGNGDMTVTLGSGATVEARFDGVFANGNATVTLGPDARIDADGYGVGCRQRYRGGHAGGRISDPRRWNRRRRPERRCRRHVGRGCPH